MRGSSQAARQAAALGSGMLVPAPCGVTAAVPCSGLLCHTLVPRGRGGASWPQLGVLAAAGDAASAPAVARSCSCSCGVEGRAPRWGRGSSSLACLTDMDPSLLKHANLDLPLACRKITYLEIFEDEEMTLGIFCFPAQTAIPLHNHPDMTVVSRCVGPQPHCTALLLPPGPRGDGAWVCEWLGKPLWDRGANQRTERQRLCIWVGVGCGCATDSSLAPSLRLRRPPSGLVGTLRCVSLLLVLSPLNSLSPACLCLLVLPPCVPWPALLCRAMPCPAGCSLAASTCWHTTGWTQTRPPTARCGGALPSSSLTQWWPRLHLPSRFSQPRVRSGKCTIEGLWVSAAAAHGFLEGCQCYNQCVLYCKCCVGGCS